MPHCLLGYIPGSCPVGTNSVGVTPTSRNMCFEHMVKSAWIGYHFPLASMAGAELPLGGSGVLSLIHAFLSHPVYTTLHCSTGANAL